MVLRWPLAACVCAATAPRAFLLAGYLLTNRCLGGHFREQPRAQQGSPPPWRVNNRRVGCLQAEFVDSTEAAGGHSRPAPALCTSPAPARFLLLHASPEVRTARFNVSGAWMIMLVAARDSSRCARRLLHENDEFMLHCGQWITLWALYDGGCNGLAGVCQSRRSTWTRHTCRRSGHHNQTSSACIVAGDDIWSRILPRAALKRSLLHLGHASRQTR